MYSLELLITIAIATLIVGALIGAFAARGSSSSQRTQRQLETRLSDMEQQADNYQQQVSEHFNETAKLLNQLTASYRDVHNHLAKGAQTLALDSSASRTLKQLSTDDNTEDKNTAPEHITPPLDYAPKSEFDRHGVLNEEFGLDKDTDYSSATTTKKTE